MVPICGGLSSAYINPWYYPLDAVITFPEQTGDYKMGWFNSDKSLREREEQVQAKYDEIKTLLQSQQNEIAARFQDLGNLGATIMTRSDLETIYQEQKRNLDIQQSALADAITAYHEAAERFTERERELDAREKEIIAKECDAKAEFAAALDEHIQPMRNLKAELDAKGQRILAMQEEFNKNFAEQDGKLLDDFKRLAASLKEKFDGLQAELIQEKEKLAEREDAINKREMALSLKEAEVRQGLTAERSQLLVEFNGAKTRLAQRDEALKKLADELGQRRLDLERSEGELAKRIEAVQAREVAAEAGFAKEKERMLAEIQESRNDTAKGLLELQKNANLQCDTFLQEWQALLAEMRGKMLEGLTSDVQERRAAMAEESQNLLQQKKELLQREQEIAKRENDAQTALAAAQQKELFLQEKEKIMGEHFKKIAEERIAASQSEMQSLLQSRTELSQKYAALQMELAQFKSNQ